jgi:hypothetical protein
MHFLDYLVRQKYGYENDPAIKYNTDFLSGIYYGIMRKENK